MIDQTPAALKLTGSRLFTAWLADRRASLAFTTYQAGKLFFIGLQDDGRLSVFERSFARCMGLGRSPTGALWMATLYQLWRFENFLDPGDVQNGHDAVFVPVTGHTTGDIDIHDIHEDTAGQPVFVATRFNCLATLAARGSFRALWRPPFIDRLAAEDRCHLNGFDMQDGAPRYATAVSQSNVAEGWRAHRRDGGVVMDIPSGEAICGGLSMPHSPRFHDGRLWIIQSGTGEFGHVDPASGTFQPVAFLPGFARGITFIDHYAVIGVSKPRADTFEGLALQDRLADAGTAARCELAVVNLRSGDVEHRLQIEGIVEELYDVTSLPGLLRPSVVGFKTNEIRLLIRPETGVPAPNA